MWAGRITKDSVMVTSVASVANRAEFAGWIAAGQADVHESTQHMKPPYWRHYTDEVWR
jgi:hypothetical protein